MNWFGSITYQNFEEVTYHPYPLFEKDYLHVQADDIVYMQLCIWLSQSDDPHLTQTSILCWVEEALRI